jgi:hypothetical protein
MKVIFFRGVVGPEHLPQKKKESQESKEKNMQKVERFHRTAKTRRIRKRIVEGTMCEGRISGSAFCTGEISD